MRTLLAVALAAGVVCAACGPKKEIGAPTPIDAAADAYVRLVLALGERDSDSLDSYHGPAAWQAEARARYATLDDIRTQATTLAESLSAQPDDVRRDFLIRQLHAIVARIDILQGARPTFDAEAQRLFGLEGREGQEGQEGPERQERREGQVRVELNRILPGRGDLAARYAAFDRQ